MSRETDNGRIVDWGVASHETGLRVAPGCYATGDGLAGRVHEYLSDVDDLSNVLVTGGETALDAAGDEVERSLDTLGVEREALTLEGECTPDRVGEYRRLVEAEEPDVLVGLGGGKALDTAKLAAEGNCPVALLPTVASTCAAWTPLSVTYEADGSHLGTVRFSRCPEWVLVDTGLVARAPSRLLAAGVMDATAKYLETTYIPDGETRKPAQWGVSVAREAYRSCLDDAAEAVAACERGELTETVEDVIDACIAGPGLAAGLLGGQSHLLLGHVLCYCLRENDAVRERSYHGERVAYGVLCFQLVMGEAEAEVAELKRWYEGLSGRPLDLESLGLPDVDERTLSALARAIDEKADYDLVDRDISRERVREALVTVEAM